MRSALALALAALALSGPRPAAAQEDPALRAIRHSATAEPATASDLLARHLGSQNAEVRSAALQAFLSRPELAPLPSDLAPLLADPAADVRELAAAVVLQSAGKPGCGRRLADALAPARPAVQAGLLPALAACKEPEARGPLGRSLGASDAGVRAVADRVLRLAAPDEAGRVVATCLEGAGDRVLIACVEFARDRRLVGALPSLARTAVGEIGAPELKAAALAAVRGMQEEIDAGALAQKARESTDRLERAEALQVLTLLPGDRTYVALTNALADSDEYVRSVAASSLGEFGDRRAVGPLARALDQPANARIRKTFQRALDRLSKR